MRTLPLLRWTPFERQRAIEILRRDGNHPQTFVRAWAFDSLSIMAGESVPLVRFVEEKLREFDSVPTKSAASSGMPDRSAKVALLVIETRPYVPCIDPTGSCPTEIPFCGEPRGLGRARIVVD